MYVYFNWLTTKSREDILPVLFDTVKYSLSPLTLL
jgi:hypothetical protein